MYRQKTCLGQKFGEEGQIVFRRQVLIMPLAKFIILSENSQSPIFSLKNWVDPPNLHPHPLALSYQAAGKCNGHSYLPRPHHLAHLSNQRAEDEKLLFNFFPEVFWPHWHQNLFRDLGEGLPATIEDFDEFVSVWLCWVLSSFLCKEYQFINSL